jgi:hypothetical protein
MDRVDNLVIPDVTKQHYILNIDVYPKSNEELTYKCIQYEIDNFNEYLLNAHKYNLPLMPEELYKNYTGFSESKIKNNKRK